MAEAKKLPSGNYRVRVYDKETKSYKSFTAETKDEAELMALEWKTGRKKKPKTNKTIEECIDEYINLKGNILSPTTIDKYDNIKRNQLSKKFLHIPLLSIDQNNVQEEINRLSGIYSPKTVHNAHGLISAVLRQFYPELNLHTTLPKKQKIIKDLPTVEQIIEWFKGSSIELIVLLGVWQGFRVSEIRGLKKSDFKDGILTINRVIVTVKGQSIEKTKTKTVNSRRQLQVPKPILKLVNEIETEYITTRTGVSIYKSFKKIVKKHGYNDITFHDLRHLNASVMLALGVPDKYAMERGGWSTTSTLKNVYQQTMSNERKEFDDLIDSYFSEIYDTKYDTQSDK